MIKMRLLDFPQNIMVEPTNICNARCPLCPAGAGILRRPRGYIDPGLFKRLTDEIQGRDTMVTLWNYGEPFLHPQIFELIRYAADRKVRVVSSTNGYAFNSKASAEALARSGLCSLIISIDGATDRTNSLYRKGIDLERLLSGVKYFQEIVQHQADRSEAPALVFQMVVFRHNEDEVDQVRALASSHGAAFELKTANLGMVPGVDFEQYLPTKDEYQRYEWSESLLRWQLIGELRNSCSFVETSLVVNWDGSVTPCCFDYLSEYVIGNLVHQSICQVWKGKPLQQLRELIQQERAQIPMCASCSVDRPKRRIAPAHVEG